jgi:hypothetical protein
LDRAGVGKAKLRRIIPIAWGIGAALAVAAGIFVLLTFYVIFTWGAGMGIAALFAASSVAYGAFIALPARKKPYRQSARATSIAVLIPCIVSVAALITDEWLGGFGIIAPFVAAAVLYGILVARAFRDRSVDHLPYRAAAAILLPILGSGLGVVWVELDPYCSAEFADGILPAVPLVAGCFAALILLHGWVKRREA